ncbi:hypothetical protein F4774DRAFT_224958 [Daldinia eschscholtzii]|nr:hypothetical protein F4774DRAFT_224958 [Daldinia eschscholtzii]
MDILAYDDNVTRGQSLFLISTVVLAVGTWAIAGLVLWLYHDDKRRSNVKLLLGSFWRNTSRSPRRRVLDEKKESVLQGV